MIKMAPTERPVVAPRLAIRGLFTHLQIMFPCERLKKGAHECWITITAYLQLLSAFGQACKAHLF